jgi:hypothetical protein
VPSTSTSKVALVIKGLHGARLERNGKMVHSGAPVVNSTSTSALLLDCTTPSSDNVFMYAGEVPPFVTATSGTADAGCAACPAVPKCPVLDGSGAQPKLTVGINDVAANTEIEFTVAFKNALEAQSSQKLSIEVISCDASYVIAPSEIPVKAAHKGTNQEPLTIVASAPFTVKKACQSSPCTRATNTITVSLQPKFALSGAKEAEITIRGLKGSDTADGLVTLLTGTPIFESKAKWRQSSGTLVLKVASEKTLATDKVTVVQFDITNPRYQQEGPETIEISASGDVPHAAVCMDTCTGLAAPLKVDSGVFRDASVNASSTTAGANNTITVAMKPTCALLCEGRDSVVTVEGLVGSMTPDTTLLPVTMIHGSATLFKSAIQVEDLSFTYDCALADNKVMLTVDASVEASPVGSLLQLSSGTCKDRYAKIRAFDEKSGCATLDVSAAGKWADGKAPCDVGAVKSIQVAHGGEGFKAGAFIVDSETGSGLTGTCAVDPSGAVVSIAVDSAGKGYPAATVVRCPRKCPVEQAKVVSSCACGCGCGSDETGSGSGSGSGSGDDKRGCSCSNASKTSTDPACEPVQDFGLRVSTAIDAVGPVVSGACSWSRDAGRLTCQIHGCMKADAATSFSVMIRNGMSSQDGQTVNVMAGGKNPIGAVALTGKAMQIDKTVGPTESVTATCVCRACDTTTGSTPALNYTCVTAGNADMGAMCTCKARFSDLAAAKIYGLNADMQCNSATKIKSVKIAGIATELSLVSQAPSTCSDSCSSYHRILSGVSVPKADTTGGSLEVEIESETEADPSDYCGSGDMFKAVVSLAPVV